MKEGWKKGLIVVSGVLCFGLAFAGAACADRGTLSDPTEEKTNCTGVVHFLERGEPNDVLGEYGDVCLVATTGEFFRKTETGWTCEELFKYNIEGEVLTVSYRDGSAGTYTLASTAEGDHVHTYGDAYTVYAPKCVIPGIGVKYCTECYEAVPEILPVVPENHDINEENYGKCDICGKLKDGTPGFEVKPEGGDDAKVTETQIRDVFEQASDGDTIVMGGDLEIQDATDLHVSDKDITLDVKGNDVDIKKDNVDSTGLYFEGGALTITDSTSTPESTERSKFTLNVTQANNFNARDKGTYAMRVDNTDVTITNVDFEIINSTTTNSHAMYVDGGTINVESDAKITMKQGTDASGKQTAGGFGMSVTEGAEVNLNGAEVESDGPAFMFVVGRNTESEKDSVVNINAGTVINYTDSACGYSAFYVTPKGVVNLEEGATINVNGAALDPSIDPDSAGSDAIAFAVVGGGTVNVNGEINLGVTRGVAHAVMMVNNYMRDSAGVITNLILDGRCTIGATAKIKGVSEEGGGGIMLFSAQRNGIQKVISGQYFGELTLATGDDLYSVVIQQGAQITINDVVVDKNSYSFAKTDDGYATNKDSRLDLYTADAVKDLRELS